MNMQTKAQSISQLQSGLRIHPSIIAYDGGMWPFDSYELREIRGSEGQEDIDFSNVHWSCSYTVAPVNQKADALDVMVRFCAVAGETERASVQVKLYIAPWSADNYVLVPGAVYNGNRFLSRAMPYPPMYEHTSDMGPDAPDVITNVPRLQVEPGISRFQQSSEEPATPAIGFYDPNAGEGVWLLTEQRTSLGSLGVELTESEDRTEAAIVFSAPCLRDERSKGDSPVRFAAGSEATLRFRVYRFPCANVQGLFDRFAVIRKDLIKPPELQHTIPFSQVWSILERKYNEHNWESSQGYYSVGMRDNRYQDWQAGWVGGGMSTYPLLLDGEERSRDRAWQTLDFLFTTQTESGFFHGISHQGKFFGDGFHRFDADRWHLVRKSGDVLYFLMKQLLLLRDQDPSRTLPVSWISGTRRLADAFTVLWEAYGQFGQFVDVGTGEIIVGGSTGGAIVPAGLALAGEYFGEAAYLRTAEEASRFYYDRDVRRGMTTGGPGEILKCPDSESAFALLESFVVLYETTNDTGWIAKAVEMAKQCMTWCVSYDFMWPEGSEFGRLDIRTAGSVIANVQNKHSSPGICTLSGDSLFKLFRCTGDRLYLNLIREIAHNLPQYVSREDRPIRAFEGHPMPPGWINERVNMSDWEGKKRVGEVFYGSCWPEVSMMLTCVEVPGLYVQPDTGFVFAIDHIVAEVMAQQGNATTLRLTNPTSYPAQVKVWVESGADMSKPLGQNALTRCHMELLAPGETKTIRYALEGER